MNRYQSQLQLKENMRNVEQLVSQKQIPKEQRSCFQDVTNLNQNFQTVDQQINPRNKLKIFNFKEKTPTLPDTNIPSSSTNKLLRFSHGPTTTSSAKLGKKSQLLIIDMKQQGLEQIPENLKNKSKGKNGGVELNLDQNNIQSMIHNLQNLPQNLKVLKVSHNKIAFMGNIFEFAPKLKILDVADNRLISLEGISKCYQLRELNVSQNYLSDDQLEYIKGMSKLRKLDLSYNQLTNSQKLQHLIFKLRSLRYFSASDNQIEHSFVFKGTYQKLREIKLNNNKLRHIIIDSPQPQMKQANFSYNELVSIEGLENISYNLELLNLECNKLSQISNEPTLKNTLYNMKMLKFLNLNKNNIREVAEYLFTQLYSLQELLLNENNLTNYKFINSLNECPLKVLSLGYNKISRIEELSLPLLSLEILNLDNNYIIDLVHLEQYTGVRFLSIQNNKFDPDTPVEPLLKLKKLENLSIDFPPFQDRILSSLPHLKFLDNVDISQIRSKKQSLSRSSSRVQAKFYQQEKLFNGNLTNVIELKEEMVSPSPGEKCREFINTKEKSDLFNEVIHLRKGSNQNVDYGKDFSNTKPLGTEEDPILSNNKMSTYNKYFLQMNSHMKNEFLNSKPLNQVVQNDIESELQTGQTTPCSQNIQRKNYLCTDSLEKDKDEVLPKIQKSQPQINFQPIQERNAVLDTMTQYQRHMNNIKRQDARSHDKFLKQNYSTPQILTKESSQQMGKFQLANCFSQNGINKEILFENECSSVHTRNINDDINAKICQYRNMTLEPQPHFSLEQLKQQLDQILEQFQVNDLNQEQQIHFSKLSSEVLDLFKDSLSKVKLISKQAFTPKVPSKYNTETINRKYEQKTAQSQNHFEKVHKSAASIQITRKGEPVNPLELIRSPLAEFINVKVFIHQGQNANKGNLVGKLLKDVLQIFDVSISNFQIGKILFERNDEVQELEKTIEKNAENFIKSDLFKAFVSKHIEGKEIGQLRSKLLNEIERCQMDASNIEDNYSTSVYKSQMPLIRFNETQSKQNQRYQTNEKTQASIIVEEENLNKSQISKPSPMVYFSRHKNQTHQRQRSQEHQQSQRLYSVNNDINKTKDTSINQHLDFRTHQNVNMNTLLDTEENENTQSSHNNQITTTQLLSSGTAPKYANGRTDKQMKVQSQIMTYSRYPLVEITPAEANKTFVRDLLPEISQYEFKMLKYFIKCNNSRLIKAVKSYNYEKMQKLEKLHGTSFLLFYSAPIQQMNQSIENQQLQDHYSILSPNIDISKSEFYKNLGKMSRDMLIHNKKKRVYWKTVICLTQFNRIHIEKNCNFMQFRQLSSDLSNNARLRNLQRDGFDSLYFQEDDLYICLNNQRALPCYLVEYSFKPEINK